LITELRCYQCRHPITSEATICSHCGALLVLYSKYPVQGILRSASENGIVYKAHHPTLLVDLVIKQAPSRLAGYIRNEARILQSLRHRLNFTPHVYDFYDQYEETGLVMDLIDGLTLDKVYPQRVWPVDEVKDCIEELLQHLEALHTVGIIHRDLKPQNIIKRPDGSYALIDFNIAKRKGEQTEYSGYSRHYAPPEQQPPDLPGEEADQRQPQTDERSDLYALARTAYELLTGQFPDPQLQPPRRLRLKHMPAALEHVLLRMLAFRMEDRPASAAEARRLLHARITSILEEEDDAGPAASASSIPSAAPQPPLPNLSQIGTEPSPQPLHLTFQAFPAEARGRITGIAWSPVTSDLAIATACGIRIYDAASRRERLFRPTPTPVRHIGYALGGTALAFALDKTIEVRAVLSGENIHVSPSYSEDAPSIVLFAPAGQTLAVVAGDTLSVFDIEQGLLDKRVDVCDPRLAVSAHNGRLLATSSGYAVRLWWIEKNRLSSTLLAGDIPTPVVSMAITPDGRTLAIASHSAVQVWAIERRSSEVTFRREQPVRHIALAPDGQRLALVSEAAVQIYNVESGKQLRNIALPNLAPDLFQIAFDHQGRTLAAASAGLVGIWDSTTGREITRQKYTNNPKYLAFAPDDDFLAAAGRGVQLWDIQANANATPIPIGRSTAPAHDVLFSHDGKTSVLAAALGDSISVWKRRFAGNGSTSATAVPAMSLDEALPDGSKWELIRTRQGAAVQSHGMVVFARRGSALQMLKVARASIDIWPLARDMKESPSVRLSDPLPYDVALTGGGWVAAVALDQTVRVWRIGDHRPPHVIALDFAPNSIALAPDGQTLAAVADDVIQVWRIRDSQSIDIQRGAQIGAGRIVFAPDSATLATMRRNEIDLWRLHDDGLVFICTARGHTDIITDVAFSSADWRRFASASDDGTMRLWRYSGPLPHLGPPNHNQGLPKDKTPAGPAGSRVQAPSPQPAAPAAQKAPQPPRLQIFLCHVSEDRERVLKLRKRLDDLQFRTWEFGQIKPGEKWRRSIRKHIEQADIFIACLSHNFVNKQSYAQEEIAYALQIADRLPGEQIYIIPLRLDACTVPDQLSIWQWVDYFDGSEPERLVQALHERADEVAAGKGIQPPAEPAPPSPRGAIAEPEISPDELDHLQAMLDTHRRALGLLRLQVAALSEVYAPVGMLLEIATREQAIRRIKLRMQDLAIPYTDEYVDRSDGSSLGTIPGKR
jgi:serine/threonine protein kinase